MPVTPAYERAAAALSAQVASGGSFVMNLEGEGSSNPFEYEAKAANGFAPSAEVYRQISNNREVQVQTLQSLEANAAALSGPSQFTGMSMPASAFPGSNEAVGAFDGGPSQTYAGWSGAGGMREETASAL